MTGDGFVATTAPVTVPPATLTQPGGLAQRASVVQFALLYHRKRSTLMALATNVISFQFLFYHS